MFGFQACVWRPSGNAPAIELQKHALGITVTVHQTIVSNGPDDEPPPACAFHFVVISDSRRRRVLNGVPTRNMIASMH
jgi:hypothetical protein